MKRIYLVSLAIAVLLATTLAGPRPALAKMGAMQIAGGDLPHAITVPFDDASSFSWQDFGDPPLVGHPEVVAAPTGMLGTGYQVQSDVWGDVRAQLGAWPADGCAAECGMATYYPTEGVASLNGVGGATEVWVRLDPERRAVLGRYIELGRAGLLPAEPSILDVLAAGSRQSGALPPVSIGGRALTSEQLSRFWTTVSSQPWPETQLTITRQGGRSLSDVYDITGERFDAMAYGYPYAADLVIAAPGGREVKLAYYPLTSTIAMTPANWTASSTTGIAVPAAIAERFALNLGITFATPEVAPPPTSERSYTGLLALLLVVAGGAAVAGTLGTLAAGSRPRRTA